MYKLSIIAILTLIISCTKSSDSSPNIPPVQKISYKLDGVYREFDVTGVELYNSSVNAFPPYTLFYSFGYKSTNEEIGIYLVSTTFKQLTVGDYYAQSPVKQIFPNGTSILYPIVGVGFFKYSGIPPILTSTISYQDKAGDFAKVTVSRIENNYVSGTFSGSATIVGGTQKVNITEGVLQT
ncbi:MAG TPA: hypothetical protein VGP43_06975 [Chitinophagaceae bacterium]|nr:hypothetical protein [Chitinophagaceae bacterium]